MDNVSKNVEMDTMEMILTNNATNVLRHAQHVHHKDAQHAQKIAFC